MMVHNMPNIVHLVGHNKASGNFGCVHFVDMSSGEVASDKLEFLANFEIDLIVRICPFESVELQGHFVDDKTDQEDPFRPAQIVFF